MPPCASADRLPARAGLLFTDLVVVATIVLVCFVALDPLNALLIAKNIGRWGPFFASLPLFAIAIYARLYTRSLPTPEQHRQLLQHLWPTLLFATWVLVGSLYARYVKQLDSTMMPMGLFAWLGAPLTAWLALTARNPQRLLVGTAWLMYGLALVTSATNAIFFREAAIFHSVEHLVFPVLTLPFLMTQRWSLRLLSLVIPIVAAIGLNKLTGYLLLVLCFGMLGLGMLVQHLMGLRDRLARWTTGYWAALATTVACVAVVALYKLLKSDLPDGNTRYRLHTYGKAIDRFLSSPIWGQWFAETPVERFELFTVATTTQVLPTHNDSLDILAHGGLLGAGLFVLALGVVVVPALRLLMDRRALGDRPQLRAVLAMHVMTICTAVPVFSLNPVLNNHNRAWSFWIHVGLAITLLVLAGRSPSRKHSR